MALKPIGSKNLSAQNLSAQNLSAQNLSAQNLSAQNLSMTRGIAFETFRQWVFVPVAVDDWMY